MRPLDLAAIACAATLLLACGGDSFSASNAGGQAGQAGAGGLAGAAGQGGAGAAGLAGAAGAAGLAGAAGAAGAAGQAGAGGSPANAILVSPAGQDSNDGLTPAKPVRTLERAIQAMQEAKRSEIRMCAGSYELAQTVKLPAGTELRGGYDCATFTTQPAPVTKPCEAGATEASATHLHGKIDGPLLEGTGGGVLQRLSLTGLVQGLALANSTATVEQCSIAVDPTGAPGKPTIAASVIGGNPTFTQSCIAGGAGESKQETDAAASVGLQLTAGSTAKIVDCNVSGGSGIGQGTASGSLGVLIASASPELTGNLINGGTGSTTRVGATGSAGVFVVSTFDPGNLKAGPRISKNTIDGGDGAGSDARVFGSIGLAVACVDEGSKGCNGLILGETNPITGNTISGGGGKTGKDGERTAFSQAGVVVQGSALKPQDVRFFENTIEGGKGSAPELPGSVAISLRNTGGRVARNSILGGRGVASDTIGVELKSANGAIVAHNMIHSGVAAPGAEISAVGVELSSSKSVSIAHNTVVLGDSAGLAFGLLQSEAKEAASSDLAVINNLFLSSQTSYPIGVEFSRCPVLTLSNFEGNLFVNFSKSAVFGAYNEVNKDVACGAQQSLSVSEAVDMLKKTIEAKLPASLLKPGAMMNNAEAREGCAGSACLALPGCADQDSCAQALFASWDAASDGATELVQLGGWKLKAAAAGSPALPCALINGLSKTYQASSVDRFNTPRTDPPSRGAHEQDLCQ